MCRNIRPLFNFEPPRTPEEVRAAAIQFVRKVSGMPRPARTNEEAFRRAVDEVTATTERLLDSLVTTGAPRDRDQEARKGRERGRKREEQLRARIARPPETGS